MKNIITTLLSICMSPMFTAAQSAKIEFEALNTYPEGIIFAPSSGLFYVSGVRMGTVGSVDIKGNYTELLSDSTLKSTYGMKVVQNTLWFCAGDANYSKYSTEATHKKTGKLIAIDLTTKKRKADIDLSTLYNGKHFINDITIDNAGNAYLTDSYSPVIYKVTSDGKASIFAENDLFKSPGVGLNGIVWHPDGFLLVDNNGAGSILKVSADGKIVSKVKVPQFFSGADGLLLDNNKNLILVQNKSVNKIFQLKSNDSWSTATVIAATKSADLFSFPSTATLRNNEVWVMNAKLNELSEGNAVPAKKFTIQKANFIPVVN